MILVINSYRGLSYDLSWTRALFDYYGGGRYCDYKEGEPDEARTADRIFVLHGCTAQGIKIPEWLYGLERRGQLVVLTGNDYKLIAEKKAALDRLQPDLVGTLAPGMPYGVHIPHALDDITFNANIPHHRRPVLVGFRGFRYPSNLDGERNRIVDTFAAIPGCDCQWRIEDDYADWMAHCKAVCASEAGMAGHKAISSRHFEAIGSRAALVMYPGDYSGCLGEQHYIRLEPDHGNLDDCLRRVADPQEWEAVTTRALDHALAYHTYRHRIAEIERMIGAKDGNYHLQRA